MGVRVRLVAGSRPPAADPLLVAALDVGVSADEVLASTGSTRDALSRLQRSGLLEWCVDGASAVPLVPGTPLPHPVDGSAGPSVPEVSRFAILRRDPSAARSDAWLLESGRSPWQVRVDATHVGLLGDLRSVPAGDLRQLLELAGMLVAHDDDHAALVWEPHDRYFASRSRSDIPRSAGHRMAGVRPPEPAIRTDLPDGPRIALPAPDGPRPGEPSLWEAMESRRSIRTFADAPVPLADLGELLWRTLRVVDVRPAEDGAPYDRLLRPVPSGGAMHATDLWLLCSRVDGVPHGVWRYDPVTHELVGRAGSNDLLGAHGALMRDPDGQRPPVAGVLTARHTRTSWKYGGIALALELKDVGVIMEAVQLAAGAVGLGMCPWGSGPTGVLARLLGIDPEVDMPVGEFALGVPATAVPR